MPAMSSRLPDHHVARVDALAAEPSLEPASCCYRAGVSSTLRCFAFVLACGATIAPLGDHFHVACGVTRYLTDFGPIWFGNSPLWFVLLVAPFMAVLAVLQGGVTRSRGPAPDTLVFASPLWVAALYLTTSFFPWREGLVLDVVMIVAAGLTWLVLDRTRGGLVFGIGVAIVATGAEWSLVQLGVFEYLPGSDGLFGVAPWLLPLYLSASVCVGAVGRRMLAPRGAV